MVRVKKTIETYAQLRKRVGNQFYPSTAEIAVIKRIYQEEMLREKGELAAALVLVYLAGKLKGACEVTKKDMEIIAENMLIGANKNASTTANSESKKARISSAHQKSLN